MNTKTNVSGEGCAIFAYDGNYSALYHDTTNNNWNTFYKVSASKLQAYLSETTAVYYLTKTYKLDSFYSVKKASNIDNVIANKQWICSNANYYENEIIYTLMKRYSSNDSEMTIFWYVDFMDTANGYYYLQYKKATSTSPAGWFTYNEGESAIKTKFTGYSGSLYYFYPFNK